MGTTSILQALKAQIIADLAALGGLSGVTVVYSLGALIPGEYVHSGKINATGEYEAGRDPGTGLTGRRDVGTIDFHIQVVQGGNDNAAVEARVVAIQVPIETYFAGTGPVVAAGTVIDARISAYAIDSYTVDENVVGLGTIQVSVETSSS